MTANAVAVAFSLFCMSLSHQFWMTAVAMGFLAIGLSMNFALANTIVQERAPSPLRGRISAVFGLSFFGLMPIAGLGVTGLSDLIGMRNALGIASVCFGVGAFVVLSAAGRNVCDATQSRARTNEPAAEPVVVPCNRPCFPSQLVGIGSSHHRGRHAARNQGTRIRFDRTRSRNSPVAHAGDSTNV